MSKKIFTDGQFYGFAARWETSFSIILFIPDLSNMNYMYAALRCTWGLCLVLLGWWWWWDSAEVSLLLRSLPLCPL